MRSAQQEIAAGTIEALRQNLRQIGNPAAAEHAQRFFKTGPGQYGEGDRFLGIRVPVLRSLIPAYRQLTLPEICTILPSPWHEERLFALLLLVDRYRRSGIEDRTLLFFQYLDQLEHVNNWDLVDCSAPYIVGAYLLDKDATLLQTLASSVSIWERRIAIIATFAFIRHNRFDECLLIAGLLRNDPHDLIHKAVGWMLREVGKRDQATAEGFLRLHYQTMPRTMLRYAIERYPQAARQWYLGRPNNQQVGLRHL